jgi:hypothetical protein
LGVRQSLWIRVGRHIPIIFHPCQLEYSLINFDDMSKYTLTKEYSCHDSNNSHVIIAMWIYHVDVWQQCLHLIQHKYINLPRLVPHVLKQKKVFGAFIMNLAPQFQTCLMLQNIMCQQKHILHYHVIRGHCHHGCYNGRQIKHNCNMNLLIKHKWSNIIIIHTIQKSFDKRYFNCSNNIIVKHLL